MYILLPFIIFLLTLHIISPVIVFPFIINTLKDEEYTASKLYEDYFLRDFYTTTNMGSSPSQNILTLISTEYHYFILSADVCGRKSTNYIYDLSIAKTSGFYLEKATSYNNVSDLNNFITNYKNGGVISDTFNFYNTTYLKCQPLSYMSKDIDNNLIDSKTQIKTSRIVLEEYKNDKKCAIIGLNRPYALTYTGISIIEELKRSSNIQSYDFTFIFFGKNEGQLIIGQLPHEYENDRTKNETNYIKINGNGEYTFPWVLLFKEVFFENKNKEKKLISINRNVLVPNIGFIIANDAYKELIKENYFNDLIKDNICEIETINVNISDNRINFTKYDMISCNKKTFTNNMKGNFPTLNFSHIDYNYNFTLTDIEVFLEKGEKIYFLIIFPYNGNKDWYLGLPFIQKYQFVFNHDSKTIGFYNPDLIKGGKDDSSSTDSRSGFKYLRLIIEILVAAIFAGIAFFVAKKIYEQRKKRANELADDDFDYNTKEGEEESGNKNSLGM